MVDFGAGLGRDDGLGVKGDTQPGGLQHGKIIRAVADGDDLAQPDAGVGGLFLHRLELRVPAKDGIGDAGNRSVLYDEAVGVIDVETGAFRHGAGEEGKAAETSTARPPLARMVAVSSRAPGVRVICRSSTS